MCVCMCNSKYFISNNDFLVQEKMSRRKYYYTKKYRQLENLLYISSSSSSSLLSDNNEISFNNNTYSHNNDDEHLPENTLVNKENITFASTLEYGNDTSSTLVHNEQCAQNLFSHLTSSSEELYHDEEVEEQCTNIFKELYPNITFEQKIRNWSMKHISNLNNKMLSELLCILKVEHNEFPKTAEAFLRTNKSRNVVKPMLSANGSYGTYIYFGLEKVLTLIINPEIYVEDTIEILVNIDGVQIYRNSRQQFWPILIMLHNRRYIAKPQVIAIYHRESKPKSSTDFLDEFIKELLSLMTNKITLSNKTYSIKVLGFVCDTPARAFIKCVKSHVAFYACERCTVKGKTVGKNKRIYPRTTCEQRSKESFQMRRQPEHHLDNEFSPLLRIPDFDPVQSVLLDSMHLLFLGVAKSLLNNILFGGSKTGGIGPRNRLLLYNLFRSLSGQIPAEFQRKVYDIFNFKNWKATQFRFFLLYNSALVLRHVLPIKKYKHFCLLYVACRILCSNNLTVQNVRKAKKWLILFFRLLPKFYGLYIQSINFHNLIHIADDVSYMGCH